MMVRRTLKRVHRKQPTGSLSIEMMVAVGILAALFSILAAVGSSFKKVDDHHWTRHALFSAGQAQMDAIAATGKPIDEKTFKRLWPQITCTVEISEGENPWQGLQKVHLDMSAKSRQTVIKTSLIRYMRADKDVQK